MSFVDKDKKICFIHIAKNAGTSMHSALENNFTGCDQSVAIGGRDVKWSDKSHITYQQAKRSFPSASKDWFAFALIREPLSRFMSAFHFLNRGRGKPNSKGILTQTDLEDFTLNVVKTSKKPIWQKEEWWTHYVTSPRDPKNIAKISEWRRKGVLIGGEAGGALVDALIEAKMSDPPNLALEPHVIPQTFYFDDPAELHLFRFEDMHHGATSIGQRIQAEAISRGLPGSPGGTIIMPNKNRQRRQKQELVISDQHVALLREIYKDDFALYETIQRDESR